MSYVTDRLARLAKINLSSKRLQVHSSARSLLVGCVMSLMLGMWLPLPAHAQLFSYTKGEAYSTTASDFSGAYKVEYRQLLYKSTAATFDYINEGHFPEHHRDGYGLKLWYEWPVLKAQGISLAAGIGPYYYFDTITPVGGQSADVHGLAPIVSFTARGPITLWNLKHLDWLVSADSIAPNHDFKSHLLSVGVGYWMSPERHPRGFFETSINRTTPDTNELSVFGVLSVINISGDPDSWGASAEYRHRFTTHFDGTLGYIYEGDPRVARRSGLAAQVWPVRTDVRSGIEIGAGFGAYAFVDTKHQPIPGQVTSAAIAPMVSIMLSYPAHSTYFARFIWDRVVSNYSRDADIWRLGFGKNI